MDTNHTNSSFDLFSVSSVSSVAPSSPPTAHRPLLALPQIPVTVRPATMEDLAFIDGLQKKHTKQVGWMPTKQLEGKIALGQVIVAIDEAGERVGYCIGHDQYFKHDDVGIIYQMNVLPGRQRGLIGATLLKAQFERSAYGCKLYCCWCAQDIAANRFWEAMGFVPLAFRAGSRTRGAKGTPRVHIFWQKRIRAGDTATPWWYPAQTSAGSIREDRLVLPIPPGTHWGDAKPIVLPAEPTVESGQLRAAKALPGKRRSSFSPQPSSLASKQASKQALNQMGSLRFASPAVPETVKEKPKREPRPKVKNDPLLVARARELRDRWIEHVSVHGIEHVGGKYDVSRAAIAGEGMIDVSPPRPSARVQTRLLAA